MFLIIGISTDFWYTTEDASITLHVGVWRICSLKDDVLLGCLSAEDTSYPIIHTAAGPLLVLSVVLLLVCFLCALAGSLGVRRRAILYVLGVSSVLMVLFAWIGIGLFVGRARSDWKGVVALEARWSMVLSCFAAALCTVLLPVVVRYVHMGRQEMAF